VCIRKIQTLPENWKKKNTITDKKISCRYLLIENFQWKLQQNKNISSEISSVFLTCQIANEITDRMLVDDLKRN
jgi:hypothetical protein